MAGMTSGGEHAPRRTASVFSAAALAVVTSLCLLYVVSQFLRNSVGVIAPDLAREVGLSAMELGLLSSIFFFMFGITQIPLGVALDRFGPRLCMLVCVGFVVLGCVLFGLAQSASGLITGRALLGLGCCSFLVAPVALYARWFPPSQFSTLAGVHLGIGTLGALFATAPLAFAAATFGWRETFLGVGALSVLIGLFAWLVVSDDPPGVKTPRRHETLREGLAGVWEVIRTPSIGRLFLMQLANYPTFLLVVGLWGGPYLTHIYGVDLTTRGEILFVPALAQVVGSLFWGPMDRVFGSYKAPALTALGITFLSLLFITVSGNPSMPLLLIAFIGLGFSTGLSSILMAHGRTLVQPHLLGRCITLLNIGTMGGGFLVQFISGAVIGLFPTQDGAYPLDAYRLVFGLQAGFILIAGWAYFGSKESRAAR
jgi:MFS family permease